MDFSSSPNQEKKQQDNINFTPYRSSTVLPNKETFNAPRKSESVKLFSATQSGFDNIQKEIQSIFSSKRQNLPPPPSPPPRDKRHIFSFKRDLLPPPPSPPPTEKRLILSFKSDLLPRPPSPHPSRDETRLLSFKRARNLLPPPPPPPPRAEASFRDLRTIYDHDLAGLDCDFLSSSPPLAPKHQMSSSDDSMPQLVTPTPPKCELSISQFKPKPFINPLPTDLEKVCDKLEEFQMSIEKEPKKKRLKQSHSPPIFKLDQEKDDGFTSSSQSSPRSFKKGLIPVGSDWIDTPPDLVSLTDPSDYTCSDNDNENENDKGKGKGKKGKSEPAPEPQPRTIFLNDQFYTKSKPIEIPIRPTPLPRWSIFSDTSKNEPGNEIGNEPGNEAKNETRTEAKTKIEAESGANFVSNKQVALVKPYTDRKKNNCLRQTKPRRWIQVNDTVTQSS